MLKQDRPRNFNEIATFLLEIEPAISQYFILGICSLYKMVEEMIDEEFEAFCNVTGAPKNAKEYISVIYKAVINLVEEVKNHKSPLELVVYRIYGQPKISKPKILKGLKPAFSIPYHRHKNQVFFHEEDVYVYFFDLFSKRFLFPDEEDASLPTVALQKKYPGLIKKKIRSPFGYADAWCPILSRNEGWVKFKGLLKAYKDAKAAHVLHDYHTSIENEVILDFLALSRDDPGFEKMWWDVDNPTETRGVYATDYIRFVRDMLSKIYQMIAESKI